MEGEGEGAAAPPQIKVALVSMVTPSLPPPIHRMFLSNLDLLALPNNNNPILLFYKFLPENEQSSMVERLKKSLSSVLELFYPLAGRIVEGESGRLEVDCNSEGVEFVEATANIPFDDLEKEGFQRQPYFTNLAPTIKPLKHGDYGSPLFSIQFTSFMGGSGICIGFNFHHVIADGNSIWHFMTSWGECNRGLPVSNPPIHNRMLLKKNGKNLLPLSFKAHEISNDRITGAQILKLLPDTSQSGEDKATDSFEQDKRLMESIAKWWHQNSPLKYSTFQFSKEMIGELKQRTGAPTSFISLAAQFWRSVVKAREFPEQELVSFMLAADCRARLNPPLPPTYFGNCLSLCIAQTTAQKLLTEDVSFAAQLIKEAITAGTQEEQIDNFIGWNNFYTIFEALKEGYPTVLIGSMRFPAYEMDFGWGKPLNAQFALLEIGTMALMGATQELGVPVSTCLPRNAMEKFTQIIFD